MKTYGEEFKREAEELAQEIGVRRASEKLSVSEKTLYGWRRAAERKAAGPMSVEAAEAKLRQLEKENDELRRANEILKKAMGLLAR